MSDSVLVDIADGIATVTLNRPQARNALNSEMMRTLPVVMGDVAADDRVSVVVLTGADPAFCAGLDLKELGSSGTNLSGEGGGWSRRFWAGMAKPVIGAVNGPAITGGLELALQCDFLVASEQAVFGDTHSKVGVIPGGGMSILLPQRVGFAKAIQMSLTGRFLDAAEALRWGLATFVVPHDDLLPFTHGLAADIVAADQTAVRAVLDEYRHNALVTGGDAWDHETERFLDFRRRFDPATVKDPRPGQR
jgi:enoyl-CoA hydratase